jgi:ribosomal protein L40E
MTLAEFTARMTIVGELLTKIAIVGTGWGFYREGLLSLKVAAASVCAGLLLSFGRDQNLRNRGIVRLVPNFGYVWAACMIMLLSTLWAVEVLVGTAIITSVRATAIASICAMAYSVYATTCEAAARQVFRWIFNCDDGELDRVTGRREDTSSYDYSDDDEYEDDSDIEEPDVVEKKFCDKCEAIIDLDATRCWTCGHRCKVTPPDRLNVIEVPRLTVDPDR